MRKNARDNAIIKNIEKKIKQHQQEKLDMGYIVIDKEEQEFPHYDVLRIACNKKGDPANVFNLMQTETLTRNGEKILVDSNMYSAVNYLNMLGYTTKYCCSGHVLDKDWVFYDVFEDTFVKNRPTAGQPHIELKDGRIIGRYVLSHIEHVNEKDNMYEKTDAYLLLKHKLAAFSDRCYFRKPEEEFEIIKSHDEEVKWCMNPENSGVWYIAPIGGFVCFNCSIDKPTAYNIFKANNDLVTKLIRLGLSRYKHFTIPPAKKCK